MLAMVLCLGMVTNGARAKDKDKGDESLPPGLQKKEKLPPGLEKKGKVPPGWQKKKGDSDGEKEADEKKQKEKVPAEQKVSKESGKETAPVSATNAPAAPPLVKTPNTPVPPPVPATNDGVASKKTAEATPVPGQPKAPAGQKPVAQPGTLDQHLASINAAGKNPQQRNWVTTRLMQRAKLSLNDLLVQQRSFPQAGLGDIYAANVMADQSHKPAKLFLTARKSGKEWGVIATENGVDPSVVASASKQFVQEIEKRSAGTAKQR